MEWQFPEMRWIWGSGWKGARMGEPGSWKYLFLAQGAGYMGGFSLWKVIRLNTWGLCSFLCVYYIPKTMIFLDNFFNVAELEHLMVDRGREDFRCTWAGKAREAQENKEKRGEQQWQSFKGLKKIKIGHSVELDAVPGDLRVQSQWVGRARSWWENTRWRRCAGKTWQLLAPPRPRGSEEFQERRPWSHLLNQTLVISGQWAHCHHNGRILYPGPWGFTP